MLSDLPRYPARTFFETETAFPAGFSHKGDQVLIGSDRSGVMEVYVASAAGGELRQAAASTGEAQRPISFVPGDERILLASDTGGNEVYHLFLVEADGTRRDLIPDPKARATFLDWSRDGKYLFVRSNERDPRAMDVYRYAVDRDFERELVWENQQLWSVAAISPNGRYLALNRVNDNRDSDVYLVDLDSRERTPARVNKDGPPAEVRGMTFNHDSTRLIFRTDAHGEFRQMWSHDIATGEQAVVLAADWDVAWLEYSSNGRYRAVWTNEDGTYVLGLYDEQAGAPVTIKGLPEGDVQSLVFSDDEQRVAVRVGDEKSPGDVFVVELSTGSVTVLTNTLNPAIDPEQLVQSEVIRFKSFDDLVVPALLYKPREASPDQRAPALLWIHGGPGGQSTRGYNPAIQHLVNHGYAILAVNNRGSSGYGKTFFHLDDRKHGADDLDDIVHAKRWMQKLDWVDPDRIGILGGSYGGYIVLAALAFRPQEFAIGIDIFGVANWIRTLESIPPWWAAFRNSLITELGDPEKDRETLEAKSPLLHPEGIVRPLLVVQGANDPRVLQAESDEIVAAVRANNVPVEYLVFDDEGHGFRKRDNRISASESYLRFADRYLR